jgi:hypothetical protein
VLVVGSGIIELAKLLAKLMNRLGFCFGVVAPPAPGFGLFFVSYDEA